MLKNIHYIRPFGTESCVLDKMGLDEVALNWLHPSVIKYVFTVYIKIGTQYLKVKILNSKEQVITNCSIYKTTDEDIEDINNYLVIIKHCVLH